MGNCFQFGLNSINAVKLVHTGGDAIAIDNIKITMEDQETFKCIVPSG